jgi:magnesium transporter
MLINCAAYQEGRKLADIKLGEIHAYVARPDCFVWVALADPSDAELAAMQGEFHLHELAVEDAGHSHETVARPKVEEYGDTLFVVMNTVELTATDEIKVGEMAVFVGRNYVCRCAGVPNAASGKCARAPSASRSSCATVRATCSTP